MDHISVNATNFFVIGFSSALFTLGGLYILAWLGQTSIPVISVVAQVILSAIHKL